MSAQPIIRTLGPVNRETVEGPARALLDQAHKQLGFVPNMYALMANAPGLLSTYLHGYSLFRAESGLKPAEQEVVFLAASEVNGCDYCTAAHSMIADKVSGVPKDVLAAIRARQPIPDARLAALHAMVVELITSRGRPNPAVLQAFLGAGFDERTLLYIVLAIAVKTVSNFSNRAFATPVDERFADYKIG